MHEGCTQHIIYNNLSSSALYELFIRDLFAIPEFNHLIFIPQIKTAFQIYIYIFKVTKIISVHTIFHAETYVLGIRALTLRTTKPQNRLMHDQSNTALILK